MGSCVCLCGVMVYVVSMCGYMWCGSMWCGATAPWCVGVCDQPSWCTDDAGKMDDARKIDDAGKINDAGNMDDGGKLMNSNAKPKT